MLQKLALAAVGLILAGCAETSALTVIREGRSGGELAEIEAAKSRMNPVLHAIYYGNQAWCPDAEQRCKINAFVGIGDGIGALADRDGIHVPTVMTRVLKNDAEIGLIIGHEWAHLVLQHGGKGFFREQELAADCVGALATQWAGYDAAAGADIMTRLGRAEMVQGVLLATLLGVYGGDAKLPWDQRYRTIVAAAAAAKASPPSREAVEKACGVRL